MFDKTYITEGSTEYVPYEKTVNINKPSTAEDLQLVKQIRDEAEDDIIAAFRLSNNLINDAIILVQNEVFSSEFRLMLAAKINGKNVKEEGFISKFDVESPLDDVVIGKIKEIAKNLIYKSVLNGLNTENLRLIGRQL